MVFPVVMYGCESWIVKKAEHRRIDAFELWCWFRCSVNDGYIGIHFNSLCHMFVSFVLRNCIIFQNYDG